MKINSACQLLWKKHMTMCSVIGWELFAITGVKIEIVLSAYLTKRKIFFPSLFTVRLKGESFFLFVDHLCSKIPFVFLQRRVRAGWCFYFLFKKLFRFYTAVSKTVNIKWFRHLDWFWKLTVPVCCAAKSITLNTTGLWDIARKENQAGGS